MKNKIVLFLIALLLLNFFQVKAQDQDSTEDNTFSLSGQFRSRAEYRDGAFRPLAKGEKPAALVQNRVRLNLNYQNKDLLETRLSLQNVNIWGQANTFQANDRGDNTTSLFEGWAAMKIANGFKVKAGRQTISYEDGRLFDATDWTNAGRSHDALAFILNKSKFSAHAYLAFNQNYEVLYGNNANNPAGNLYNPANAQNYKTMQTVWGAYQLDDFSHLSVLFSNVGFQNATSANDPSKVQFLQTMGLFYGFNYPQWFGNVSGFVQTGHASSALRSEAYVLSGNIGRVISDQFRASIGTDYMSGNEQGATSSKNRAFQPLYGTGHKFFGAMDYFTGVAEGLMDNNLSLFYTFSPKVSGLLAGHLFSTTTSLANGSRNLGQELDLKMDFKLQKFVSLTAGFSTYFTTRSLLQLKNVSNAQSFQKWGWLTLNVNPEFFRFRF